MQEFIGVISGASFTEHCHALATRRLDKPKSFANKAKEYWTEITTGFYHFERGISGRQQCSTPHPVCTVCSNIVYSFAVCMWCSVH